MSQDSNTENGSSAKKKLSLKRKPADRSDAAPAKPESASSDAPRMKFSPKPTKKEQPAKPAAPTESPLVPQTPLAASKPADKPKLQKPKAETEPPPPAVDTESPDPAAAQPADIPLSFSPASEKPPLSPAAPKPPPGVKIVKDEEAPPPVPEPAPSTVPPLLPPVLNQAAAPSSSNTPPPMAAPSVLLGDDPDVKPVKMKAERNNKGILSVIIIFLCLVIGLVAVGYAITAALKDSPEAKASTSKPSHTIADDSPEPSPGPATLEPESEDSSGEVTPIPSDTGEIVFEEPESVPTTPTLASPSTEAGKPDPAVTAWVAQMRPNAIIGSRMSLDGSTYHLGDTVHEDPDIEWIGHDPDLGVLTFRDANGILYEKDY